MNPNPHEFTSPSFTLISFLVLIIFLSLTLFSWHRVRTGLQRETEEEFNSQTTEIEDAIKTRIEIYKNIVLAGKGFIEAGGIPEREEWRKFVASFNLEKGYPGIQGLGLAAFVPKEEKARHEEEMRKSGFPRYAVLPEGERSEYVPIIFLEPFSGRNLRAFGYDMFSEPIRRDALERARDDGEPILSGKVRLVQETGRNAQAGFLLYSAAYKSGLPQRGAQERRAALLAYSYAPFRMNDFMQGIFSKKQYDITFEVYDGADPELLSVNKMYAQDNGKYTQNPVYFPLFKRTKKITVIDHDWTISYISLPQFGLSASQELIPLGVLSSGTLFSFLLFGIINSLSISRRRAVSYARTLTRSLAESEEKYRRIFEGLFDVYYLIRLDGTILLVSPSFESYTGVPTKSATGRNIKEFYVKPEEREELLKRQLQEREIVGHTVTIRGKYNASLLMSVNSRLIRDERGNPSHIEGFMRDITEIAKTQRELKARSDELERLNKSFIGRELKMIELKQELEKQKNEQK